MHHPTAPIIPILDKSCLFVNAPTDPQNPSRRYIQCPATGHLYCTSTGSLYQKMTIPLSVNISPLLSLRNNSGLLPSISTPCTIKTFSVCTNNINQQDNCADSNTSPKVKDVEQPIQGNSALMSNIVPNVKNAHQQIKSTSVPKTHRNKASKSKTQVISLIQGSCNSAAGSQCHSDPTTWKEKKKPKDIEPPIQGNSASMSNIVPNVKNAHQQIKSTNAPKTHRNKASKSKTQVISLIQGSCNSAAGSQSHSDPTTWKEKKKPKDIEPPIQGISALMSNIVPNVKNAHQQIKSTNAPKTHRNKASKSKTQVISPIQGACNSAAGSQSHSDPTTWKEKRKPKNIEQPIQGNSALMSNIVPNVKNAHQQIQSTSAPKTHRNKASKSKTQVISPVQGASNSAAGSQSHSDPTTWKKKKKRSRKTKKKINSSAGSQSNFDPATKKKLTLEQVFQGFKVPWAWLRPFNRRPHPHHDRQKSLLSSKNKNCIMAFSVHEIIHSRFAKNTNEHMPVSQVRTMLNSGDRKLRTRNKHIQQMEEEAIHKYKKMNLEKHKQRLQVKEYDVLHHPEKSWLVSYGRWVINRKDEERWPLLVKCLYKYPDSTLRQACKHRSFCLRWNGTFYTLRMDHAYYTQIQCHMAVTETPYAELIVHTHKETTFLPVYFDCDFWKQTEATLETFFTSNVQPYLEKIESNPVNVPLESDVSNVIIEE